MMNKEIKKFSTVSMDENKINDKLKEAIYREKELYSRNNEVRSEFERDYTRILHSLAYRRLKHKTQVFFNTQNDHISSDGACGPCGVCQLYDRKIFGIKYGTYKSHSHGS